MIVFDHVGKAYRNRKNAVSWVFRDFSAVFEDGVNVGILAPANQGKTTLTALASGNEAPSEGRIYREGRVSWPYGFKGAISQKLSGKQNLRFLTDVYGGNFGRVYEFVAEFCELERHIDSLLKNYNNEMRHRFSVGALFAMGFEHILIDDSLDYGDGSFRRKCVKYLDDNRDRFTLLMATGNVNLVRKYCEKAGVLNEGRLEMYDSVEAAIATFSQAEEVLA